MYFEELGPQIRQARKARKLTQAQLAQAVDLSRTTICQIETGACPDIGIKKLMSVLEMLDLELGISQKPRKPARDYLEIACISVNVSYRGKLRKQELAHTLVTGKAPADKRPQLRVVFDELPPAVFDGMVR